MKPARAFRSEDLFPIDIAWFKLRNRGVTTIRAAGRRAHAKATFRKVETVAHGAANAVKLHPLQMRLVHTALVDQILDQSTNCVIGERGHDRGVHTETALQSARDVILTAAFPHLKTARGRDTSLTRIETHHHLT